MKRLVSVLVTFALLTAGTSILAANSPTGGGGGVSRPSVKRTPVPVVTVAPTATPEATVDPEATVAPEETGAPILAPTATPSVGTGEVEGGLGYTDLGEDYVKDSEIVPEEYVEYKTYDVWGTDEYKEANPEGPYTIVIDADLYDNDPFQAIVNYGDGWVELDASQVKVNGDGTVTVTLDKFGMVSFWVDGEDFPVFPGVDVETPDVSDVPSGEADYTVDENVDYTVVSPQTGYAEAWVVDTYLSTIL